jgi:hypothetical protein
MAHLELENNKFYPELLDQMKKKGQDISKTELFIAEMKGIEAVVLAFLKKYSNAEGIEKNKEELKTELLDVIDALTLRVEAEEVGVYSYWGLF